MQFYIFVLIQNDFKLFTSPQDYGEKVIAKIREFNVSVGQVYAVYSWYVLLLIVYCFFLLLFVETDRESVDKTKR